MVIGVVPIKGFKAPADAGVEVPSLFRINSSVPVS